MWISSDLFSRKNELIYELFEVFVLKIGCPITKIIHKGIKEETLDKQEKKLNLVYHD